MLQPSVRGGKGGERGGAGFEKGKRKERCKWHIHCKEVCLSDHGMGPQGF